MTAYYDLMIEIEKHAVLRAHGKLLMDVKREYVEREEELLALRARIAALEKAIIEVREGAMWGLMFAEKDTAALLKKIDAVLTLAMETKP